MTKKTTRSRLATPASGKYGDLDGPPLTAPPTAPETPPTTNPVVAAILADRPPPPTTETPVYGRRKAGMAQLSVTVDPELKRRLRRCAEDNEVTMAEIVERMVRDYLAAKG